MQSFPYNYIFFFVSNDVKLKATGNCHVLILNNTKGAETEVKHLGVAIDGGEQVLHVGRPPRQLAPAAGAAAHLGIVLALVAQGMSLFALIDPAALQRIEADRTLRTGGQWR